MINNKKTKIPLEHSKTAFLRGQEVDALYLEPEIYQYAGNPLICALPKILTEEEAIESLEEYPDYHPSLRNLPNQVRYHSLQNGLTFFSPLDINLDLERRFSVLIRLGYVERNPLPANFWKQNIDAFQNIKRKLTSGTSSSDQPVKRSSISQYGDKHKYHSTKVHGFNIIGMSGVGKTQTIERILSTYPQLIHHTNFEGNKLTYSQLVWLKLECPFDASVKGLCLNFFQAIDSILGTNYYENYGKGKKTDELLACMALVAANHGIGVLVIDEIQRLNAAHSGGAEKMLYFFSQLVNTVGVPVVLCGTYKALPLFSGDISELRRGTGQGDLVWDRMSFDEQWQSFAETLWRYQFTKNFSDLEKEPHLSEALYDECQGVTDLAVKAFIFAQERAIQNGTEKITASIIRSAAKDKFRMLQHALNAIRLKDIRALEAYEDAYPLFKKHLENLNNPHIAGEISRSPQVNKHNFVPGGTAAHQLAEANSSSSVPPQSADSDIKIGLKTYGKDAAETVSLPAEEMSSSSLAKVKTPRRTNGLSHPEAVLPALVRAGGKTREIYTILRENNFIRSGDEFWEGGLF